MTSNVTSNVTSDPSNGDGDSVGPTGGLLLLVVGITCLRLVQTGAYTSYVRVGMHIPLLIAGAVIALLGIVALVRYARSGGTEERPAGIGADREQETPTGHEARAGGVMTAGKAARGAGEAASGAGEAARGAGEAARGAGEAASGAGEAPSSTDVATGRGAHRDHGRPAVALLLVLPTAIVYLVAPPSLGAFSATRATVTVPPPRAVPYAPLHPAPDGTVTLPLREVVERAYDHGRSLVGHRIRVTGFVAAPDGRQLLLTRFVIRCCAADAEPAAVNLTLPDGVDAPAENTWITVLARWDGAQPGQGRPGLVAQFLQIIPTPADPYET